MENLLETSQTELVVFNLKENNLTKHLKEQVKEGNDINLLLDKDTAEKKSITYEEYLDSNSSIHDYFLKFKYEIKGDSTNIQLNLVDTSQLEHLSKTELSCNKSFINKSLPRRAYSYIKYLINSKDYEVFISLYQEIIKLSIHRV